MDLTKETTPWEPGSQVPPGGFMMITQYGRGKFLVHHIDTQDPELALAARIIMAACSNRNPTSHWTDPLCSVSVGLNSDPRKWDTRDIETLVLAGIHCAKDDDQNTRNQTALRALEKYVELHQSVTHSGLPDPNDIDQDKVNELEKKITITRLNQDGQHRTFEFGAIINAWCFALACNSSVHRVAPQFATETLEEVRQQCDRKLGLLTLPTPETPAKWGNRGTDLGTLLGGCGDN